jgi:hypothetical protein
LDILARYSVEAVQDLEFDFTQGVVGEHPAWEDLITIENLDTHQRELDGYLGELRDLVSS